MNYTMKGILAVAAVAGAPLLGGCAAAVGAGAAAGAYEYQNKEELERLEADFERGEISREEYLQRKRSIEEGSAVY